MPLQAKKQFVIWGHYLFAGLLRNRQTEFGEDFFHILPDLSAVIVGVVAKQIGRVKGGHKFYGFVADAGDIFVEHSSQLTYGFGGIEQCLCGVCAEGDDDFRVNQLDLPLQIGDAGDYLFGFWVAVIRRPALEDVANPDVLAFEAAGGDDFI